MGGLSHAADRDRGSRGVYRGRARPPHPSLNVWDGLWWAVTTVTTVGYGDVPVETDAGRIIAMAIMIAGIGFVAMLTAAAAERFVARDAEQSDHDASAAHAEVLARLDEIATRLTRLESDRGRT
jgi:voltage-gated potassium channel